MFRIKICGVTSAIDARAAAAAGADAIGLNFYAGSRRYLPPEAAGDVAAAIPQCILKVGVFVNAPAEFVCSESDRLRLDLIQLAGVEMPEYLRDLGGRPTMKAFRPRLDVPGDFLAVVGFLKKAEMLGFPAKLVLIDAHHANEFGGTGKTVDWPLLSRLWNELRRAAPPLVLAGGLKPDNVREAIETVGPAAVDVASGIESAPGVKDPLRMRQFVSAALAGFHNYPTHPTQASSLKPQASGESP
jgi:phosphoribosylanthranilate isomerase